MKRGGANHWCLTYNGFDPAEEGLREALCTLSNGYVATRGAAPESSADGVHYPGTYIAGCYNRLDSALAGRTLRHEDLVNLPNWLPVTFRIEGGQWFDPAAVELLDYRLELDTRRGVLTRRLRFHDGDGRVTGVAQRRFVSMADRHVMVLETTMHPENWDGRIDVKLGLDGQVINSGVQRYRDLDGAHLRPMVEGSDGIDTMWLQVTTATSGIRIAEAARISVRGEAGPVSPTFAPEPGRVDAMLDLEVRSGQPVTIEKVVSIFTSTDRAISESLLAARSHLDDVGDVESLLTEHVRAWGRRWRTTRVTIPGESQRALNVHLFHLNQILSDHVIELDVGIPARGLHGEAYRGHIFWDEVFVFPTLLFVAPEVARAVLMYRWRRLPAARRAAAASGYRGAMYPWQSGSDGSDETPLIHLNPRSGRWFDDNSRLQRHVSLAVAYNVWQYYQVTGDLSFLQRYGAEMLIEIARFWCSIATYNPVKDRYEILGVMGPDEYHDAYPGADSAGIDNNAYTNVMVTRCIRDALTALNALPEYRRTELLEQVQLDQSELDLFEHVSRRLLVAFHGDGVISQFEGYGDLDEFDWDGYRAKYDNIRRLDRILEAEGDTTNRYQVSKQADVLMLLFLLGEEELMATLSSLGYVMDRAAIDRTIDYYLARTTHGSTLSAVVHSWVLARSGRQNSWPFFLEALDSDIRDIQGGTTREGIHLGAMAGTIDMLLRCYTGLEVGADVLKLNPRLPRELPELRIELRYRGHWGILVHCTHRGVRIGLPRSNASPITVAIGGEVKTLAPGESWRMERTPRGGEDQPSDRQGAVRS